MISSSLWLSNGPVLRGPVCQSEDQGACQNGMYPARGPSAQQKQGLVGVLGRGGAGVGAALWRRGYILCCVLATLLVCGSAARAQTDPPGPMETMEAYRTVRDWVRSGEVPDEAPEGLPACAGASVTLMLEGRVVGRASEFAREGEAPGRVIWRAGRAALVQARAAREDLRERGAEVRVSLELGGALTPMTDDELSAPALTLSPGLDGVAVRRGERVEGVFPGQMLRRGSDAGRALVGLIGEIAGDARAGLEPIGTLKERGYVFYRFRATHLAQPEAGAAAVFLQRGGRVVERREISLASLRAFAGGLAGRLEASMWPGVEPFGIVGAYDPVTGAYVERLASAFEQALAAMALARYASCPGVEAERGSVARRRARAILEDLARVEAGEIDARKDVVSSAACIVALTELGDESLQGNERLERLGACLETLEGAWIEGEGFDPGLPAGSQGLLALAKLRSARFSANPEGVEEDAREWILAAYRETASGVLVSQMPWLGWASVELAARRGERVAAADTLREMRDLVWDHQLRVIDLDPAEQDLAGGIVFTRGPTPLPTWLAVRPLAFIATMLGHPELTGGTLSAGEAPGELGRLVDSLRFLRQLSAGEAEGHMYAEPERARWGVRRALWDQRMEPGATAMTLLAVTEALRSLEALQRRE